MIATSAILLGIIGLAAAVILYIAAKKFQVYEDPKIAEIEDLLPGANCGGCGFSGCHAFAVECAQAKTMEGLNCTGVDNEGMKKIAGIVGLTPSASRRMVAVVKCSASCENRDPRNFYDGVKSCAIEASLYQGESDCTYGCLGCGDCVRACPFGAMQMLPGEELPHVDFDKCTGCGKCVSTCPRALCELTPMPEGRPIVWVACANRDRGPVAMKECGVACIGCTKCRKVCPNEAPTISSFLAHIDQDKCTSCGECLKACPRKSITSSYHLPYPKTEIIENVSEPTSEASR